MTTEPLVLVSDAGAIRTVTGAYSLAFWISGGLCLIAGAAFLTIGKRAFHTPANTPLTTVLSYQ